MDGPEDAFCYWNDLRNYDCVLSRMQNGWQYYGLGGFCWMWWVGISVSIRKRYSTRYNVTSDKHLLPFIKENFHEPCIFQQGNALIHTTRLTRDWFKSNSIQIMAWPAKSSDLNPIENIRGILCRRVCANKHHFSNATELESGISREWKNTDQNTFYNLVRSKTNR